MNRVVISTTIVGCFTLGVCLVSGFYFYKKWKSGKPPKNWRKIGNVVKLYTYPLKSGRNIECNEVECTKFGFSLMNENGKFQLRDRSFIVYGEKDLVGKSARLYPSMILINISSYDNETIILEAPNINKLLMKIPSKSNSKIVKIQFQSWSDEFVPTIDCGNEASVWISQCLLEKNSGLRIGYHDHSSYRSLNAFKDSDKEDLNFYKHLSNAAFGLYSDLAAALLINRKSFNDLNDKLDNKISITHFRPNIVIDGPELEAFDEDNWLWLKIGDVIVKNIKDCTRCVLTTVNPETGVRDISREPLKTLSKYRISKGPGKGPIMGVNLEIVIPGAIKINDEIYAGIEE